MPVEINELVIRATINNPQSPGQPPASAASDSQQNIQQLLNEVIKKINDKEER